MLLGNTLYLVAFSFYTVITFLGYNSRFSRWERGFGVVADDSDGLALPFLQHTEILLVPVVVLVISWAISLLGFNVAKHVVPLCMF